MCLHVLTRFPKARGQRTAREKTNLASKSVARPPKKGFHSFCNSKIEMKSQRATANAAERQRSRSEADTRRRTGASFGLCLFFGRESRPRFSRRVGLSMGLWIGR